MVKRDRPGIGRLEALVVIVLAICVFVTVPQWLLHNREAARKEQKMYRFRRIGQAMSQYYDAYRTYPVLPKARAAAKAPRTAPTEPRTQTGLRPQREGIGRNASPNSSALSPRPRGGEG